MNFQGLLDNALGGQEEIVVRALMEKGILQRQVQCSSNHEEINMVLRNEGEAMRWYLFFIFKLITFRVDLI